MTTILYILLLIFIYITGAITGFLFCLYKLKAKIMIEPKKDVKKDSKSKEEQKRIEENMKRLKAEERKQNNAMKKQLKAIDEYKG